MKNYKTNFNKDAQENQQFAHVLAVMDPNAAIGGGGGGLARKDKFQLSGLDVFTPTAQPGDNNPPRNTLLATTTDGRRLGMRQFMGLTYAADIAEPMPSPTTVAQSCEFVNYAKEQKWWFVVLDRDAVNRTARDGRTFARTTMKLMAFGHEPTDDEINAAVASALAA